MRIFSSLAAAAAFACLSPAQADRPPPTLADFETSGIPLDGSDAPGITNHWLWAQADGRFGRGVLNMAIVRAGAAPDHQGSMVVRINGVEAVADGTADWRPNQIVRRSVVDDLEITGTVRAADRKYALLNRLKIRNPTGREKRFDVEFTFAANTPHHATVEGGVVERTEAVHRTRFAAVTLRPGEVREFRAASLWRGTERGISGLARDFETEWEAADRCWNAVLADAFTPGAGLFLSGGMKNHDFKDAALNRLYRFGVVTALMCLKNDPDRRTPVNWYGTSMPDTPYGVESYIWDVGYASAVLAQMDPAALRNVIEHWAQEGVHTRLCVPYHREASIVAPRFYASSGAMFTWSVQNYLEHTGDAEWLGQEVAGKTIWDHLLAVDAWNSSRSQWEGLSHYGEEANLFDDFTVPGYHHWVAAPNAAAVWIKRTLAEWAVTHRQDAALAVRLRKEADAVAEALIDHLYQSEGVFAGTWRQRHANGAFTQIRHGWDFMNAGSFLAANLNARQRQQMRDWFAARLAKPAPEAIWMVVQDPRDGNNGPHQMEHNGRGAYPAWPFHAAWALQAMGFPEDARELARQIAPIVKWGAIGQGSDGITGRRCRSGWASMAGASMATMVEQLFSGNE